MKQDKTKERLHITDIKAGLADLEQSVFSKAASDEHKSGLLALKIACDVFERLCQGPLPIDYTLPRVKECCLHVAAAMDLVRYGNTIQDKAKLKPLKKHFALIGAGGFGVAATYTHQQSKPSAIQECLRKHGTKPLPSEAMKDASRKTIELMVGLAALNKFDEIVLEDPEKSNPKDPNPDIIIETGKATFGIACKSLNSTNITNFKQRIAEAIRQIDRTVASGKLLKRHGIVLLDISALLDHDLLYMPSQERFWSASHTTEVMLATINETLSNIFGSSRPLTAKAAFGDLFESHQAAPCVLIYAHTLMIACSDDSIFPSYMKLMKLLFVGDHSKVKSFAEKLNRGLHCQ
jgi:hypothetical protein